MKFLNSWLKNWKKHTVSIDERDDDGKHIIAEAEKDKARAKAEGKDHIEKGEKATLQ